MRVILPSKGVLGLRSVELRLPNFRDLRKVHSLTQDDEILKLEFIKLLVPEGTDFNKITKYDLEYLYTTIVFALMLNTVTYNSSCPSCGEKFKSTMSIVGRDVVELGSFEYPVVRKIKDAEYTFHILSAEQSADAAEYALQQDNYTDGYNDACAAFTLGWSLSDIQKVQELDISVYLATFLFQQVCFHGLKLFDEVTCPKCGAPIIFNVKLPTEVIKYDLGKMMEQYASISTMVDFDGYLDFTISEYNAFISALNEKMK